MPPRSPRVITTVLLLCAAPAGCESPPNAPRPTVRAAPPAVATLPAPPAVAAPSAVAPPPAGPPAQAQARRAAYVNEPPALIALRGHLINLSVEGALAQPRFRALCDDRGYPLVGNVASKAEGISPRAYCDAVRARRPRPEGTTP